MLRTHTCGELRTANIDEDQEVTLCGWVRSNRNLGGLLFIDLRDRYGITQVMFNLRREEALYNIADQLRSEDVIRVTGKVVSRGEGQTNPKLQTGEIEVIATDLEILNKSKTPPFEPGTMELPREELRLKHRVIDLRRDALKEALLLRHRLSKLVRDYFDSQNFVEIETPMLGKSTPEGARDYLVPSRVHKGSFYALPQSPQIYKQLLMIAGFDRYYQLARCFRDEDLRADRQPEFTQIDVEMAFVERDDVLNTIDGLIAHVTKGITGQEVSLPLPRFDYREAMERFGTDKPDLRFAMELVDIGEIAAAGEFGVFKGAIESGGRVRGINVKNASEKFSRKGIDQLTEFVKDYGAKGLAFFRVKEGTLDSSIAKFFSDEQKAEIITKFEAEDGDLLLFIADKESVTSAALAALRNKLGKELELYDPTEIQSLWVIDFPLVTWNEDENRWDAEHHPFCSIVPEDRHLLETDPGKVRASSYDLVINGNEAGSGSIRIHDCEVQQQVFDLIGVKKEEAEERFGFLLDALRYGAPPHGGIAMGLDRWVMIFSGNDNIRDVIAFPKTQKASDLMSGAPTAVDPHQLADLAIKVDLPKDEQQSASTPAALSSRGAD